MASNQIQTQYLTPQQIQQGWLNQNTGVQGDYGAGISYLGDPNTVTPPSATSIASGGLGAIYGPGATGSLNQNTDGSGGYNYNYMPPQDNSFWGDMGGVITSIGGAVAGGMLGASYGDAYTAGQSGASYAPGAGASTAFDTGNSSIPLGTNTIGGGNPLAGFGAGTGVGAGLGADQLITPGVDATQDPFASLSQTMTPSGSPVGPSQAAFSQSMNPEMENYVAPNTSTTGNFLGGSASGVNPMQNANITGSFNPGAPNFQGGAMSGWNNALGGNGMTFSSPGDSMGAGTTATGTTGGPWSNFSNYMQTPAGQLRGALTLGQLYQQQKQNSLAGQYSKILSQASGNQFPFSQNFQNYQNFTNNPSGYLANNPSYVASQNYIQQASARANAANGYNNSGFGPALTATNLGQNANTWYNSTGTQLGAAAGVPFNPSSLAMSGGSLASLGSANAGYGNIANSLEKMIYGNNNTGS